MLDQKALNALQEVMGGNRDDLVELIADFRGEAPRHMAVIADPGAESGALRRAAHTLKSNLRDLGALELARLYARLEQDLGDGGDPSASAALAAAILSGWSPVKAALAAEMARQPACAARAAASASTVRGSSIRRGLDR